MTATCRPRQLPPPQSSPSRLNGRNLKRFLRPDLPAPPDLPLQEVFGPVWAAWLAKAAEDKAAPPDYVAAALLAVVGATIGNTRWASPWMGWAEPPIIWAMAIGTPSMNKRPGFDAVL